MPLSLTIQFFPSLSGKGEGEINLSWIHGSVQVVERANVTIKFENLNPIFIGPSKHLNEEDVATIGFDYSSLSP